MYKEILSLIPLDPPQVIAISPQSLDVPVGEAVVILVKYGGGYPDPMPSWVHNNGTAEQDLMPGSGRILTSGDYFLNLTIFDSVVSDEGMYSLTVDNGVGSAAILEFTVNILSKDIVLCVSLSLYFITLIPCGLSILLLSDLC